MNTTTLKLGVLALALASLMACSSPTVPSSYTDRKESPQIYPDYTDVTVPVNIAPLHFHIDHSATDKAFVTRFTAGGEQWVLGGEDVRPGLKKWHQMTDAALAADGKINV